MNFELSDSQRAIQTAVSNWAKAELEPGAYERDATGVFPADLYRKCQADIGVTSIPFPEEIGGLGLGVLEACLALEELARYDQSFALTCQAGMGLGMILHQHASPDQRQRYLLDQVAGRVLGAGAVTEPQAGSWSAGLRTRAKRDGDQWVISGEKAYVTNSGTPLTNFILVTALTSEPDAERKEFTLFLVPIGTPGLEVGKAYDKLGWKSSDTHPVYLDNVKVGDDAIIAGVGKGRYIMHEGIKAGRILISALGVGVAQGCLDHSIRFVTERQSFGKTLGGMQIVQAKVAEMAAQIEVARQYMYKAAWDHDNGVGSDYSQSICKYFATEMASRVADTAIQLHGGYGFMSECFASRALRDTRILRIGEGTSEIQSMMIAKELGLDVTFT